MGKIVIIMVMVITAIVGTIMFTLNQRAEIVPEILEANYQDIGSYALQYGINQVVNGDVTSSVTVDYTGDNAFNVLDGQINSITYEFVTTEVETSNGDDDSGYTITGTLNINPNNNDNKQFEMITPGGIIDRDQIHADANEFSYNGAASVVRIKPKSQPRTLNINGSDITLHPSTRYEITSDDMTVNLWNDHINNGKAMGRWFISINANNGNIDLIQDEGEEADSSELLSIITTEVFITANVTMEVNDHTFNHDSRAKIMNTATVEGSGSEDEGGGYSIVGSLNINPGNSANNEFQVHTPDGGYFSRDEVHQNAPGFSYNGPASIVRVRPKAQGRTLTINGSNYTLANTRYEIVSDNMTINVWNDKLKNGKAMGKWWISIDAVRATIDPDITGGNGGGAGSEDDGEVTETETGYKVIYWNP